MTSDYSTVSELPGSHATQEQLARLYQRYHTAARYSAGKRVLEVACGAGQGLGYLARSASKVVGGDYTEGLLHLSQSYYRDRIPLIRLDAHRLPFSDGAFDVVVLFEAIYYLRHAEQFIAESRRILSRGGTLIIGTVNKDWSEFARSPLSTRYYSVPELRDLLTQHNFTDLEFFGSFPTGVASSRQKVVSIIRRAVITLDLMPRTLKGRERFKRIFYGSLLPLKPEVEGDMTDLEPLVPIAHDVPNADYKILYTVARFS